MENNDLIKKIENTDLPEIEVQGHKQKLRIALLNSKYFQKSNFWEVFQKSLIFAVPSLVLLILVGFAVIQPRLIEAKAIKVARNNPEVQKLMAEGNMTLKEVKVKDGKAYVLLNLPEETESTGLPAIQIQRISRNETKNIEGVIVEVNLNKKRVDRIKIIMGQDVLPLANQEKEAVKEIIKKEEVIHDIIPKQAEIEKVETVLPRKLRLVEQDEEIRVIAHPEAEKKARVYYVSDGKKWIIQVNLTEKKVEGIQYSPENE